MTLVQLNANTSCETRAKVTVADVISPGSVFVYFSFKATGLYIVKFQNRMTLNLCQFTVS